jgi:outer membrane protein TolC
VAEGDLMQADRRPNPTVSFEQKEEPGAPGRQTMVALVWPLDLFRRPGRTAVAARSIDAANQAAADRDRQLATEVRSLAFRLLVQIHHLDMREDVAAVSRQIADLTAARVEQGSAPALERDQARIAAELAEVEVRRQRTAVEEVAAALRSAIGLPPDAPLALRQSLGQALAAVERLTSIHGPTADQVHAALDARPDFREADAAIARETAKQDLAARGGRLDVSLTAGYMRTRSMFPQLGLTPSLAPTPIQGTFHMITFGAMVMLPWRNGNQGAIAAAGAAVEAARHDREALRVAAENELAALAQRETDARAALDRFDGGLRDLARQNVDVLRESYQLGRATLVDVLAETRRYLDLEMAYADAQLDLALARIALAGALGDRP